jgi:hypothetical protein
MNLFNRMYREAAGGENDGGGGGDTSWRDALPDDIKASSTLADVKTVESLAKQFIDQAKHLGTSLRLPSENASDEDVTRFQSTLMEKVPSLMFKPDETNAEQMDLLLKQLGRPDEVDGYNVEADLKGYKPDEDQVKFLKEAAHKAGLTKKQYEMVIGSIFTRDSDATSHAKDALSDSRTSLMKDWGMAFDQRNEQATNMLKKTGAPASLIKAAEDGTIGSDTLKWAYEMVTSLGGEHLEINGQRGDEAKMTPAEAKSQIGEIMNNKQHAFWNPRDANHSKAQKDVVELHRQSAR